MSTRRVPRFERGKRARWDRYHRRWDRYLRTVAKLAPRRKSLTHRPIVVPTESAYTRDTACFFRLRYNDGLFSTMPPRHR